MEAKSELQACSTVQIVPFPSLHRGVLLFHRDVKLVVSGGSVRFLRNVAESVLITQFLVDGRIDLIDGLLFGDFEEAPAGFFG